MSVRVAFVRRFTFFICNCDVAERITFILYFAFLLESKTLKTLRQIKAIVELNRIDIEEMKGSIRDILKALKKSGTEERASMPFEITGVQLPCPDWESLFNLENIIDKDSSEYSRLVSKLDANLGFDLGLMLN